MKLSIPLKDIMIAPGKKFDPKCCSEKEVIEHIQRIYGVISQVMNVFIKDGMVEIEFKDATPEKFKAAMKSMKNGVKAAAAGQLLKAVNLFQEVLSVIPENIDARRNMAKAYLELGNIELAKQHLHECIQIDPKDSWACIMLGNIYARNENKFDLAEFYYEICLEHHSDDAMVITNYAALMMETGQFQKAEILFKKAIKIKDIPNAYYGLALLYNLANQKEAAQKVLETLFTRMGNVNKIDGSPVYNEAKKLYKELSMALNTAKKWN